MPTSIEAISLKTLRRHALRLGWSAHFYRNWNNIAGNEGFVVVNCFRNHVASDPLDEVQLREWLVDAIKQQREAP
jgi:hypothetical protein